MNLKDIKTLYLGLTNKCNAKCIICWHSNKKPFQNEDLDINIYKNIRDSLFKNLKVLDVCGGGEIFYSSLFNLLIEDIQKYKFKTIITSNFSYITEQQRKILKKLNIDFIVSLDGSNKYIQEKIRPGCVFEEVIKNIEYFIKNNKKIIIQMTVCEDNFYDIENMLLLAEKLKVSEVRFRQVQFLNNLDIPFKFKDIPKDIKYLTKITKKKYKIKYSIFFDFFHKGIKNSFLKSFLYCLTYFCKRKKCFHTLNTIKIQENGKVLLCCLPNSKIVGDLKINTLEEIINSPNFENFQKICNCKRIE